MSSEALIALFGGLTYLIMAGDLLVRGALALSRRAQISPMIVGLTVVAFGTSAPELFVSVKAARGGLPGVALGNVIGSNVANVLLVLGLPALIRPMCCAARTARRDGVLMFGSCAFFTALCATGSLDARNGAMLVVALVFYLSLCARSGELEPDELDVTVDRVLGLPERMPFIVLFFVAGLIGLQLGASLTIDAVVDVAAHFGVPEMVIALTAVAVGTSLPELATTVMATLQNQTEVALGNVLGSIVFNVLAIMGITLLAAPGAIAVDRSLFAFDLPVMGGAAAYLAFVTWRRATIGRWAGGMLLAGYVAYVVLAFRPAPGV